MKRILAFVLMIITIMSLSISAFAVPKPNGYSSSRSVSDYVDDAGVRYNDVRKLVHGNETSRYKISSGIILDVYCGERVRLDLANGTDDFDYYRQLTYDEYGELVFCYYENSYESYRMYFHDREFIKIIYKNNKGVKVESTSNDVLSNYYDWAEYALYEADYYPSQIGF